jgi:glutamate transport system permease protein
MSMSTLFDTPSPAARRRYAIGGAIGGLVAAAILIAVVWRLVGRGQFGADKWRAFTDPDIVEALLVGLATTLLAAASAIVLALVFGAVFAAGRLSDHWVLRWPSVAVVEFFRAVPLVLLILFVFLGFGDTTGRFWALVIALMLYNGSVLAEIFRAGILSVPRGQSEAGYAIGLRKSSVMTSILAPQAITSMLPAIVSQCVVALKDTALGLVISSPDVVSVARRIYIDPNYNNPLTTGLVLAAVFIAFNYSLTRLASWLEARQRREGKAVVKLINNPGQRLSDRPS